MKTSKLELRFLGVPQVFLKGREIKLTRKGTALLAYVALEGATPRETLAELLWGGASMQSSSGNLRRELHRLRETELRDHLETGGGSLSLKFFTLDTEDAARPGEFLQGLQLEDATEFEAWREGQNQQRSRVRLETLRRTAGSLETSDRGAALLAWQQIVELEPLSDGDVQNLMRCLLEHGERDEAERVFSEFQARLAQLSLTPSLETAQLLLEHNHTHIGRALVLERVGRGQDALEFRLAAAQEAEELHDYAQALEQLKVALQFQRKASERVALHQRRIGLLNTLARFEELRQELGALELSSRGDARLEGIALLSRSQWEFSQWQNLGVALTSAEGALANPFLPSELRGVAMNAVAVCHMISGRLPEAEVLFIEALRLLPADNVRELIQAHHGLARIEMQRGNMVQARAFNQIGLGLAHTFHERKWRVSTLNLEGVFDLLDQNYASALRFLGLAKRECEQTQNYRQLPMVLNNIFKAHFELRQYEDATDALEQALDIIIKSGIREMEGPVLNNLALVHLHRGQLGLALETATAALEVALQAHDARGTASRCLSLVNVLFELGDMPSAWQRLEQAKNIIEMTGLHELEGLWTLQKAELLLAQNQPLAALALTESTQDHPSQEIGLTNRYLAALAAEQLHHPIAKDALLELSQDPRWQVKILPLQLRLEPSLELRASALAALPRASALEELALRIALEQPVDELVQRLVGSLETYPELQRSFGARLETLYGVRV